MTTIPPLPLMASAQPSRGRRALAALAVGLLGASIATVNYRLHPDLHSDFDPLWIATRALLAGQDPFGVVPAIGWQWPLYYPLQALVIVIPFAALPMEIARASFVCVSAALLAYVVTRHRWWPLVFTSSAPFFHAAVVAQWSPLLTVAVLVPVVGGLLVAKPSSGLILFVARPTWQAVAGAALITAISFALRPSWPAQWLEAIHEITQLPAIRRPGGFLLLLALLRWKRPEARLLAALALVPVRPGLYEMLPLLLLVPHTFRQALVLVMGADIAFLFTQFLPPAPSFEAMDAAVWPFLLAFILVPSLFLVLRRPNEFARIAILRPAVASTGRPSARDSTSPGTPADM